MQIQIKVTTGHNCNWRAIEPLQPEGFKGQTANEKETLKNSIVQNGFHDAFDVWQYGGKLLSIDGVHRKIALLELSEEGYEIPDTLPCNFIIAKDETEAATIILSRNAQHSHILSAAVMTAAFRIPAATIEAVVPQKNLEAWGATEQDNAIQLTAEEDDFEFEDGGIETDIVLGDLFEIGNHRLLCGDSTDSEQVAKLMNGEKADMVFTDPPYGVSYQSNMRIKTDKFDVLENDNVFITEWINNLPLFSNGFVFVWTSWKVLKQWIEFCEPIGELSNLIVWDKGGGGIGDLKKTFSTDFEVALVYHRGAEIKGKRLGSVWSIGKDGSTKYLHPTQKPVELPAMAIENITNQNELVLDLFLGSGSTMVASHQLKRKCYGMELDPKYCQVIIDRMQALDPTLIIKRNGVIYGN